MTLPTSEAILAQIKGTPAPTPAPVALGSAPTIVPTIAAPKPAIPFSDIKVNQTMGDKSFDQYASPNPIDVPKEVQEGIKRAVIRDPNGLVLNTPKAQHDFYPNTELTAGKQTKTQEVVSLLPDRLQAIAETALQSGSDLLDTFLPTAMRDNNEKVRLASGRLEDLGIAPDRAAELGFYSVFANKQGLPGSPEAKVQAEAQKRLAALNPTPVEAKSLGITAFKQNVGTAFDVAGTVFAPEEKAGLARAVQLAQSAKEETIPAIFAVLKKAGVEDHIAEQYAPILAKSDFPTIQKGIDAIDKLQSTSKAEFVAPEVEKTIPAGEGEVAGLPGKAVTKAPATTEEAASKYWEDAIAPKLEAGEPVVLSGDDMKVHFGNDYDTAKSDFYAKANYENVKRAIKEAPGDFVFLGGGPASGKTEFLGKSILDSGFKGILYDTTLSSYKGTEDLIKAARDAGKNIRVYGIVPDLEKAHGFAQSRAAETGRVVTDEAFARGHAGFVQTMTKLLQDGVLKPDEVRLYDMRGVKDKETAEKLVRLGISQRSPLDLLKKVQYNEEDITNQIKAYGTKDTPAANGRGNAEAGSRSLADRSPGINRTDSGRAVEDQVSRGETRVGEGAAQSISSDVKVSVPDEIDLSAKRAGLSDARSAQEQAIAEAGKKQIVDKVPLPPSVGEILAENGQHIPIDRTPASSINELTAGKDGRSWQSIVKGFMYNAGPQKSVHIFDYLATPEFVLEKVGLSKGAEMLQDAKDTYRTTLKREFSVLEDWKASLDKMQYHTFDGVTKPHSPQDTSRLIFQYLDGKEKVVAPFMSEQELDVARDIRSYLKDWAVRLHLPGDNQISRYITHIFERTAEGKPQETFLDPDMAAIMDESPAKSVYDPFLQRRMGKEGYIEDVWRALDAYVKRASRKEAMDPALEAIESMANRLDDLTYKYVTKLTHRVNLRPTELEKGLDSFITQSPIGYRFTNRPTAFLSRTIRQTFFRGTLGLNFSSALRNLTQGANTYAKLGEKYTAIGYGKIIGRLASRNLQELYDEGVLGDEFIQDRNIGLMKKGLQKVDKGLFAAFDFAEKINRGSAYFGAKAQAIDKGLSEAQAIKYAKRMVRETQFAFGTVDTPVALNDDVVKTLAQMQTYNVKQIEFLGRLAKQRDLAGLIRFTGASLAMVYTIGQLFGMTVQQLVPTIGLGGAPLTSFVTGVGEAFSSDPQTKAKGQSQVVRSFMSLIPGGSQLLKTIKGAIALKNGKVTTASGNFKYSVEAEDTIRALIFGPNALPQAQDYYNTSAQDRTKVEFDRLKNIRDTQGADAVAAEWKKLGDTDPSMVTKVKAYAAEDALGYTDADRAVKALGVTNGQRAQKIFQEIQAADTKEAKQQLWRDYVAKKILTTDVQKQVSTLLEGGTLDTPTTPDVTPPVPKAGTQSESSVLDTVVTYAKAIGVDPATAFNRIFTGQKIKRVDNGTVIVDRMALADSQAERATQGGAAGPAGMNLDHTIPLELGGSNDKSNLKLVSNSTWKSYTPVEDELGQALQDGKVSKKTAQDLIVRFKNGELTADEVAQQIDGN